MDSIFNISDCDINLFIISFNNNLLNGTVDPQIPVYVELLKTIKHYRDNNIDFDYFFLRKHNFTDEDNQKLHKLLNRLKKGKTL